MNNQEIKTPTPFWAVKMARKSITIYHFYAFEQADVFGKFSWRYYYDKCVGINFIHYKKGLAIEENPNLIIGKEQPHGTNLSFDVQSLRHKKWKLIKEEVKLRGKDFHIEDNTFLNRYVIYTIFEGY